MGIRCRPHPHASLYREQEVTLSRDDLAGLVSNSRYFGSTVGRIANRVANATFTIDSEVRTDTGRVKGGARDRFAGQFATAETEWCACLTWVEGHPLQ